MQASHFTHQSLVPVRAEPSDKAEMVTQLLFGDLVEVLEEKQQWRRIRNADDGYEGWIDEKMIHPLPSGFLENISHWELVLSEYVPILWMQYGTGFPMKLLLGSRVPVMKGQEQAERLRLDLGDLKMVVPRHNVQAIVAEDARGILRLSEMYLASPYLWGGKGPWGIDCSGFTQMVYGLAGKKIPRDASQQVEVGREVGFGDAMAGDLAFFKNAAGRVHHVGLVLGDGQIRHAHGNVHDDWLRENGIVSKATENETHRLCSIKRID